MIPGTGYIYSHDEAGNSCGGGEVELVSGRTTNIQVGSSGRPVVGRMELPANTDTKALSAFGGASLSRKPLRPGIPRDLRHQDAGVREQLYQRWRESPEGNAHEHHGNVRYGCRIGADGSFRFQQVPPGAYQLKVIVPYHHEGPATQVRLLEALQEVTVPEMTGRRDSQLLDLGTLKLELRELPGVLSFHGVSD